MKKILLIIALALCIFQMVVLATAITIGNPAIAGGTIVGNGVTIVDKKTPADGTGTITTVEFWSSAGSAGANNAVAVYSANGNNLTTRDFEVLGAIAVNYNSFEVNLDVVEGDYIGIYLVSAEPESTAGAGTGLWYKVGDQTNVSDVTFALYTSSYISLKGTGATAPTFPIVKFGGVTITKWNTKEITKWNTMN